jgi:hypothetical protein
VPSRGHLRNQGSSPQDRAEMRRSIGPDVLISADCFRWWWRVGAALRRCGDGSAGFSLVAFDPEHGPVASVVASGPDHVVTAPPSGLASEQSTELERVG